MAACDNGPVWFLGEMLKKLETNQHRSGWVNVGLHYLFRRLEEETLELRKALLSGDKDAIIEECADVANFAMMIADVTRKHMRKPE